MSHENVSPIPGREPESSPVSPEAISAILNGTDMELEDYLTGGKPHTRRGARNEALRNALSLAEVLTRLDEPNSLVRVTPQHWSQVAWMASTMIQRATALSDDDAPEGGSDE